jgi:pyruvate/2-oxoglutarate dehydrogenase complex dihydrolipoamide dehydrogenase (E3) component
MHVRVQIQRVDHHDGRFQVQALIDGTVQVLEAAKLLVATGRRPNTQGFGLTEAGVALDPRGAIVVNDPLQSSIATIYAAGDVTG